MKKLSLLLSVLLGSCVFSTAETLEAVELISVKITLVGQGVTNITTPVYIGKEGFAVTVHQAGTNATTANLNVQASVSAAGGSYNTANQILGDIAQTGASPVRKTIYVPSSTIGNVSAVKITLTNAHTDYVIISNVVVSTWR